MSLRHILAALLLGASPVSAQVPIAFVNVNVVPMDSERVLAGQTVLVDSGRIVGIGPTRATSVPPGVRIIDGAGAYLAPGIADMHVHFLGDSNELALYVANGVTTVRDLSGEPEYFDWRREIAGGRRVGPNLLIATPLIDAAGGRRGAAWLASVTGAIGVVLFAISWLLIRRLRGGVRIVVGGVGAAAALGAGYVATRALVPFPDRLMKQGAIAHWWVGSPLEAARLVRGAAGRYDAVKLYEHLTPAEFGAAVGAARQAKVHSVGHVPFSMGLERTLGSGVDELAHLYFLVVELQASTDTSAYPARMHAIVEDVRRSGVDVTSTLVPSTEVLEQWTDSTAFLARDNLKYLPSPVRRGIHETMFLPASRAMVREGEMHVRWGAIAARELVLAGVPLVLGTDNSPFTPTAGFGAHDELQLLVASGLTPYQALRTATVNASRVAGASSRWGEVAVGMRADLILAHENPLGDVGTLRQPRGVLVAGRWYDRAALDSLLATVIRLRAGS